MSDGYIGAPPLPPVSRIIYAGTFTLASQYITVPGGYTPGTIELYVDNGIINPAEYIATDGSVIDLGSVYPAGTKFYVRQYASFELANCYTKMEADARYAKLNSYNIFTKGNVAAELPLPATTGNIILDLAEGNNFGGQLTGNVVLANPVNMVAGQSGVIRIQNGATPRTISYGSMWKSPSGMMPALTAVANSTDILGYYVESSSRITLVVQGDVR